MKENPEDDEDDAGGFALALLDAPPPRKSKLLAVAGAAKGERAQRLACFVGMIKRTNLPKFLHNPGPPTGCGSEERILLHAPSRCPNVIEIGQVP